MVNFWRRRGGTALEERGAPGQVGAAQDGMALGLVQEGAVLAELELEQVPVVVLGLAYACWRCGEVSTALVGLAEDVDVLDGADLVTCDDEASLAVADRLVPDEVRRLWRVGSVRPRFTKTTGSTYLSNGCASCDAVFGRFPLFHEALPEALATDGEAALVHLVTALVPADEWDDLVETRCT